MDPLAFFKALGDETRLRCLMLLAREGELCVCELTHATDIAQPKMSRHLAMLRTLALVADRKQGQWVFYHLHPDLPGWMRRHLTDAAAAVAPLQPFHTDHQRLGTMRGRPERCTS